MSKGYETHVRDVTRCGDDVLTVRFERPEGYEFVAGQWFRLSIAANGGIEVRTFTNAAAPADDWIELTTRWSPSTFKQALFALEPGDMVEVSGAGGRLALPEAGRIAFLIGGVGITPIRSLLRDAVGRGAGFADALLVYGNRDMSCEPYIDELLSMAHAGVRTVRVLEHPPSHWTGESGLITARVVRAHLGPDDGRPFVVTGPPVMVTAMMTVLDEIGVDRDRVVVEAFGSLTS